jgi:cytochrome c oxidase subunit 2
VRRGSILKLVLLSAAVAVGVTLVALLIPWLPTSASKERERIDFVFWFTTGICIFVFAVVAAFSIYAVVTFRARPGDDTDGQPIHGHTGLEIVWTAVPTALVTAIAIVSAIVLNQNSNAGTNPVRVAVLAQQFAWNYTYGDGVQSPVLRLPLQRKVELVIQARDVLHSFWVPEFGQKQDAVPGEVNRLVITPTKLGTFPIVCTELCGLGHSLMRSTAIVMRPAAFDRWLASVQGGT